MCAQNASGVRQRAERKRLYANHRKNRERPGNAMRVDQQEDLGLGADVALSGDEFGCGAPNP